MRVNSFCSPRGRPAGLGEKFPFSSRVIGSLLKPELDELIRQRSFNQLREILCEFPAPDIAEIFTDLRPDDEAVLLRILPRDLAAEVFEHLSVEDQEKLLQALGTEQVAQILNDLAPDDRTAFRPRNARSPPTCWVIRKAPSVGA